MNKRVTIQDIANRLGVTKGIVSRALTGKYNVSDKMRDEITHTAVEMGYDFSKLRSKNRKRSKCIMIMCSQMLSNVDYWQPIIGAITTTLDGAHINLDYFIYDQTTCNADDAYRLKSMDASGYVFMSHNPACLLQAAEQTNRPTVVIDPKEMQTGKHLQIKYNNVYSFYHLTKLLYENGHRHFLFYGPDGTTTSFTEREQGFKSAISELRKTSTERVTAHEVLFANLDQQYADNAAFEEKLLQHPKTTAIVCANDIIAYNAHQSICRMGKKVPDDFSLVGFDNISPSAIGGLELTTVNVPRRELGVEAARYIIRHITNQQIRYSQIVIDCEIVRRDSIRNIKKT